jgi:ribonuclease E
VEPVRAAAPAVAVVSPAAADPDAVPGETAEEGERRRKRRRRRRGRGRREDGSTPLPDGAEQPDILDEAFVAAMPGVQPPPADVLISADPLAEAAPEPELAAAAEAAPAPDPVPVPGHDEAGEAALAAEVPPALPLEAAVDVPVEGPVEVAAEAPKRKRGGRRRKPREEAAEAPAVLNGGAAPYVGPTPANPYAAHPLDIFDVLDAHEQKAAAAPVIQTDAPAVETGVDETVAEPIVPVIRPVLVGAAEPAERKRGWWKR